MISSDRVTSGSSVASRPRPGSWSSGTRRKGHPTRTGIRISTPRYRRGSRTAVGRGRQSIVRGCGQPARDGRGHLRGWRDRAVGFVRVTGRLRRSGMDPAGRVRPVGARGLTAQGPHKGGISPSAMPCRSGRSSSRSVRRGRAPGGCRRVGVGARQLWTFQDGAVHRELGVEEMTGVVMSPEGLIVAAGSWTTAPIGTRRCGRGGRHSSSNGSTQAKPASRWEGAAANRSTPSWPAVRASLRSVRSGRSAATSTRCRLDLDGRT